MNISFFTSTYKRMYSELVALDHFMVPRLERNGSLDFSTSSRMFHWKSDVGIGSNLAPSLWSLEKYTH